MSTSSKKTNAFCVKDLDKKYLEVSKSEQYWFNVGASLQHIKWAALGAFSGWTHEEINLKVTDIIQILINHKVKIC